MNEPILEVRNLSLHAGKQMILDRVNFCLQAGDAVALVGSNGAGKTSVLRCLLGIAQGKGEILIRGLSLAADPRKTKRLIGYMPQVPAFCESSVRENMFFVAALREVAREETLRLLKLVGLEKEIDRSVRILSTGMRQRLSLAMALIGNPPLLILDEPTASLDLNGQKEIIHILQQLQSQGQTLLLCSHRAEEVSALVDRIIVMDQGKIVAIGRFDEIAPALWAETTPTRRFRKVNAC